MVVEMKDLLKGRGKKNGDGGVAEGGRGGWGA